MKRALVKLFASGFGTGYSPIVPGTTGTVPAWLIAWFLFVGDQTILIIATVIMCVLSVWLANEAEVLYGHDAKKIVTDEWAGMFISLLFVPFTLTNYIIAFVAFRAFDVLKIPPAAQAERLRGGWGVTMDDVVAGVQANVFTQVLIWLLARYYAG